MLSLSRRMLSFGFKMTLQMMQEDIKNMQNFRRTLMKLQNKNFSVTSNKLSQINYESNDKLDEDTMKEDVDGNELTISRQKLGEIQGSLKLGFTCKKCNTRNDNKIISKLAYTKGVVIVRCDGCKNNHLIADNMGWFDNNRRNIEQILKKKGESVRRIRDDSDGYFEAVAQEELLIIQNQIIAQRTKSDVIATENDQPVDQVKKVKFEKNKILNEINSELSKD